MSAPSPAYEAEPADAPLPALFYGLIPRLAPADDARDRREGEEERRVGAEPVA